MDTPTRRQPRCHRPAGFTALELMVVIAIAAILVALAVPTFSDLMAGLRAKSTASEIFATLAKARSDALARNGNVTLSPKSSVWSNGWQVLDPASGVLDDRGAVAGASVSGPASVIYRPSGRVQGSTVPSFVVNASGSSVVYWCVSVDLTGRPYMVAASTC